jgi:hypothetical protein
MTKAPTVKSPRSFGSGRTSSRVDGTAEVAAVVVVVALPPGGGTPAAMAVDQ